MLVTAIIPQKKDPAKRNIFIDGEFAFSLIAQDVLYFKLREGEPIPQETYDTIQDNLIYIQAQDTALHYLGYKMRTEAELRRKLTEKEFAPQVIEKVMDFLCRYGYCDDKAYAKSFVKERLRLKPKGAYALKMELRQKGISEKIAEEVLAETDLNEAEDAARWILKKRGAIWSWMRKKNNGFTAFCSGKATDGTPFGKPWCLWKQGRYENGILFCGSP